MRRLLSISQGMSRARLIIAAGALMGAAMAWGETPTTRPTPAAQSFHFSAQEQAKIAPLAIRLKMITQRQKTLLYDGSLRDASKHAETLTKLMALDQEFDQYHKQFDAIVNANPAYVAHRDHLNNPDSATTRPEMTAQEKTRKDAVGGKFLQNVIYIALEDPSSAAKAKELAASTDSVIARLGQLELLVAQWMAAPDDVGRQKAADVIAALVKSADADDDDLASALNQIAFGNDSVHFDQPLRTEVVSNFPNKSLLKQNAAFEQKAASAKALTTTENKPMVLAGKTVDGKAFSSDQWKGKVILVDFWASWCGPCKAELPHVKAVYKKYHDQGLEVLAISNDYTPEALTKYLANDPELVWPNLFDPAAADQHQWNPLTEKYGINGIPRMFLIDRNGICRTVEARANMDEMIPKLLAENTSASAN